MAKKNSSKKKKKFILFKNIAKVFYQIISKIYRFIDKVIVTPIAKLILIIQKPFALLRQAVFL